MNNEGRRKIIKALKERGFEPYRGVKHGTLWKDTAGHIMLVGRPTKTDDPRALKNSMKEIERVGRNDDAR